MTGYDLENLKRSTEMENDCLWSDRGDSAYCCVVNSEPSACDLGTLECGRFKAMSTGEKPKECSCFNHIEEEDYFKKENNISEEEWEEIMRGATY
jgi:hypothetical protein